MGPILGPVCLLFFCLGLVYVNADKTLENLPPASYNKSIRPNYGGPAVNVGVTMHLISITDVSEKDMQFKASMYFRHIWNDSRLAFSGNQPIVANGDLCHKLWTPDTFFPNAKQVKHQSLALTGEQAEFCRISPDGGVYMSKLIELTLACPMSLQYYPFDDQLCSIEIESYGYSAADITYTFARGKGSVGISQGLELPDFKVMGHKQSTKTEVLSTGNYTRLVVEIQLARSGGPQLKKIFYPAFMLLVLSWFPLFIVKKPEIRAGFAFFMTLAMTFFNVYISTELPEISYYTTADTYLIITWILVFLTLVETSAVVTLSKCCANSEADPKCQSNRIEKIARFSIPILGILFHLSHLVVEF